MQIWFIDNFSFELCGLILRRIALLDLQAPYLTATFTEVASFSERGPSVAILKVGLDRKGGFKNYKSEVNARKTENMEQRRNVRAARENSDTKFDLA